MATRLQHAVDFPTKPLPRHRFAIPSWVLSLGLHACLFVLLASLLGAPQEVAREDARRVSIVLKSPAAENENKYIAAPDNPLHGKSQPVGAEADGEPGDLLAVEAPSDPTAALPPRLNAVGPGVPGDPSNPGLGALTNGASGTRTPGRGRARTSVFGASGEGYKFVYVFDRSGSMGGSGHTALAAAKAELLKSLNDLGDVHMFEIIFYNDSPIIMQTAGSGRLVFANEQNKALARAFLSRIRAQGATDHEQALHLAIRLRPDVIFFLTDADEPTLSRRQLARIKELNAGVSVINCIEFGLGPSLEGDNFLKQLARENGGVHAYFDISRLKARDTSDASR
jgi:hypothetical protein